MIEQGGPFRVLQFDRSAFSVDCCDPYGNRLEVTTYDHPGAGAARAG